MIQSMTLFMSYAIVLICLMAQTSEAKYPVTILDKNLRFSPRLFGVSTVVYNNEMLAYGGQTGLSFGESNSLFKYSFDFENKNISMDTMNQTKPGPKCTSCGAVMISQDKMLVLTHEITSKNGSLVEDVVKPYTFDLKTNQWSVPAPENLPRYNATQKHVFVKRKLHNTILGSDGCVYIVGGLNFFNDSLYMQESWYYDPVKNEYGVLSYNGIAKTRVHSSLINLPDGNIGVLFGHNEGNQYYLPGNMSIISTQSKSWLNDDVPLGGVGPGVLEDITVQTDSSNNYAYFFGGRIGIDMSYTLDNTLEVLDLTNNKWIETINEHEIGASVKPRYFASSAIINDTFITVFGTEDENNSNELGDLDIVPLPKEFKIARYIPPQKVTVTWKSQLDQNSFGPSITRTLIEHHRFHIIISMAVVLLVSIVYLFYSKISVRPGAKTEDDILTNTLVPGWIYKRLPQWLPQLVMKRRVGELDTLEYARLFVQLISVLFLGAVIGYASYNTANSSLSYTEEFVDLEYQTLPDIRLCYSRSHSNDSSVSNPPHTECQYEYTETDRRNCTGNNMVELSNVVHVPSYPRNRRSTTCYMYKSSSDSMRLYPYNPTVRFSHVGGANDSIEAVFIQFYEPSKDPNRVLFFGENLDGLGVNEMDTWIDSETQAGTGNDIMNQVLIASPESDISVQYEIVQRKRIDENNLWNYFGAAPQFIETTELAITHNDAIDLGGNNFQEDPRKVLGSVRVTPTSFRRRIITERRNNTFISEFGAVGGTVANLFALYAFLFGMKPSNPWGFVQRSAQQKKAKLDQLLNYFEVNDIKAIPLVTPVHKRYEDLHHMNVCKEDGLGEHKEASHTDKPPSEEESPNLSEKELSPSELQRRIELIEGRSQTLELILKAYYIHDEIFEQLKEAKKEKAEKEKAEKEEAEKEEAKKENSELQEAEKGNSELQKAEGDNSQVTLHNENLLDITTGHP